MSDENNGAGTSGNGGGKGDDNVEARIQATVDAKLASGDVRATVRDFVEQNFRLRDEIRGLKAQAPKPGARVIEGEDLAEYEAFRSIGMKAADLSKDLKKGREAASRLADIDATKIFEAFGSAAGMNPTAFARLAKQDGLQLEKKPGKDRDGKPAEQVFVKGEADSLTPIDEYAAAHWSDFLPALKGEATPPPKPRGTPPAYGPNPPAPRPGKGDDPMSDLPYEHAPPPM